MKSFYTATAAAALMLSSSAAFAQTNTTNDQQPSRQQERLNSIFGALFGDRTGSTGSIEAQWSLGRTPLATQRGQFESRIDSEVRARTIDQRTGAQLKSDYYDLVQLEARYGADRRFTRQEQAELAERYTEVTQVITDGGYANDPGNDIGISIADGQSEFYQRVDAQVSSRRITRVAGARLKTDYASLVRTEANYLRDGRVTEQERDDLYTRLEALDARVGDMVNSGGGNTTQTPRARLDAIARALPSSGLSASAQAQLRVEHEDISRLEAAYARMNATADERAYVERRLTDLENRARIRR
jgi:opacity protein-like surface antigen